MLSLPSLSGVITCAVFLSSTLLHIVDAAEAIVSIDDRDAAIQYSPGWVNISDSTSHTKLTRTAGATASFNFTGIGVAVFGNQGTQGGSPTVSTYTIDGFKETTYTVPNLTQIDYNFKFYDTGPVLANGPHTLLITNLNDNAWYWLNSIQVTTAEANVTTQSNDTTSASGQPTPNASGTRTVTSTRTIVGAALGGAAILGVLVIGALVFLLRKRRIIARQSGTGELGDFERMSSDDEISQSREMPVPYLMETIPAAGGSVRQEKPDRMGTSAIRRSSPADTSSSPYTNQGSGSIPSAHSQLPSSVMLQTPNVVRPAVRRGKGGEATDNLSSPVVTPPASSIRRAIAHDRRRSVDGGVRLAGPPEDNEIDDSITLPPEYGQY